MVHKKVGDRVAAGEPLCTLCYNAEAQVKEAHALVQTSYSINTALQQQKRTLVHRVIQGAGSGSSAAKH